MFAYCLNNPINRCDIDGNVSLWYFLIVDHDMGFVHRMVQLHIKTTNGTNIQTELFLTGLGRADVVDRSMCVVWEVKHAGKNRYARETIAREQAKRYINGNTIKDLGPAGRFAGTFCITVGDYIYEVNYDTPQDGVIIYTVKDTQKSPSEYNFHYAYKPDEEKEKKLAPINSNFSAYYFGIPVGFGYIGGGSNDSIIGKKYCFN